MLQYMQERLRCHSSLWLTQQFYILQGRPVLLVFANRHHMRNRSLDETVRLIIYSLDNSAVIADIRKNPLGQVVCLFDLSGAALQSLP